ncbi:MAG: PEP-CTERM sorting domain-containing protein [Phycisphaerales bacterium]
MTASTLALAALGSIALQATAASASVIFIDPFVGDAWEPFELIGPPGGTPGPAEIFDGQATIYDQLANMLMIANSLHSFPTETTIFPYNGNLMGGAVTGYLAIDFHTPVTEFGGYFGTADILEGGMIMFFDEQGQNIGTEPMQLNLGEWDWFGWSSDTPISRVEVYGNSTPGLPIVFDDLQVNYIPAPTTGALLGLAGLAAVRRRRQG